ncbi:MAG: ubiquinone/menaquinone biosynthesis methyltransferase [Candidatus Dormibacterales bacterium]
MGERDPAQVRAMFDRISGRYDLLNTILSGGSDRRWRRAAARECGLGPGGRALDVACGSGRLVRELERLAGTGLVVGLDFSAGMLAVARQERPSRRLVRSDALRLPFRASSFDAVTIAFGLRNLADPGLGLAEMRRVTREGGRLVILEFVRPGPGPSGRVYRAYLRRVLPLLGWLVGGDRLAYRYLSDTVDSYRTLEELRGLAEAAGWRQVRLRPLTLGTVGIVSGSC